jgi:CcmD family protein
MDKFILRAFFFAGSLMFSVLAFAQDSTAKERPHMAELMRSNGKIYVVVAVLLIILAGIFFYLVNLDRKISRLEKNNK